MPKPTQAEEKMTLHIIIDGDSADELFAVGPNDIRNFFLPEKLGVSSADVKQITFEKITERTEYGLPARSIRHKDDYVRGVEKQS